MSHLSNTLSSALPIRNGYLYEKEMVNHSYRTGSFASIKQLPAHMRPGEVQQARRDIAISNLVYTAEESFRPAAGKGEMFNKQNYICSDYDMEKVNKQWVRDEEKLKIDSNSRKPFKVSGRVRQKSEDIFYDPEYKFPHIGPGGGNISLDSITRSDVNDPKKFLYGQFYIKIAPSRAEVVDKAKLWATEMYKQLSKDWPQYPFKVKFTKSHEFLVMFEAPEKASNVEFPPPNNSLNRYMNQIANHGLAFTFKLKRRGDRWNLLEQEEPPDLFISEDESVKKDVPAVGADLKNGGADTLDWFLRKDSKTSIQSQLNNSEVSEDKLLGGMQPDFNRSTYIVDDVSDSLGEDAEVTKDEFDELRSNDDKPVERSSAFIHTASYVKVHLVFAFFAPWVNISAVHCLKTTAEKNRQQAKEFAEKTKREKYF